jgi:hypothetical protein
LRENKLISCVARKKESLSAGHRAERLEFAHEYLNFDEWDKTIFVDEACFQTGHRVRTLVRRPIGCAFDEQYILETAHSNRKSIPVFGLLTANGLGPLIRIEGRFNSDKYHDILNQVVLPFAQHEFPDGNFYYYQDNSPVHRGNIVLDWFEHNVPFGQLFRAPRKSADLNVIENAWGQRKIAVSEEGLLITENELWLAICDTWGNMRENVNFTANLVNSMPDRLQAAIEKNGYHTKY